MIGTRELWKNSLKLNFTFKWNNLSKECFHNSSICNRRRGYISQLGLPELIVDKPPTAYPTIRQKLDRINYYDNALNNVNIGYENDSECMKKFHTNAKAILSALSYVESEETEEFLSLEDCSSLPTLTNEEYESISKLHFLTSEFIESTIALANHYAIFRDLFFVSAVHLQKNEHLIAANSRNESNFDPKSQPSTFFFKPIVSFDAEFSIPSDDEFLCQKSCRGNLIPPEYGLSTPKIFINSTMINQQSDGKDSLISDSNNSSIFLNTGSDSDPAFYTFALVNLDSHFSDSGVCHWMVSNIHNSNGETKHETIVKYLPVYGIRGLGYHRYAFVLFRHNKPLSGTNKIDDFDLAKRKFNGLQFMNTFNSNDSSLELKPVGLSWFQTTWNDNCTQVFYKYLDMRSPTYEFIEPEPIKQFKQLQFPGRAPFNLYLDHFRDPKELSKEVLLERLKSIDPLKSYDDMYRSWNGKPMLPNIHPIPHETPDWLKSTIRHRREQVGRFRSLRPASAILPHNYNADLDNPQWPHISADVLPINCPNPYPDGKRRPKPLRETLWSKPLLEHHSTRIDFVDSLSSEDENSFKKDSISSKK